MSHSFADHSPNGKQVHIYSIVKFFSEISVCITSTLLYPLTENFLYSLCTCFSSTFVPCNLWLRCTFLILCSVGNLMWVCMDGRSVGMWFRVCELGCGLVFVWSILTGSK